MKIAAWVWQLAQDYPGANPDDSELPIDEMWVKAADGMWPQGHFDTHPAEISGLPAARALRDIYDRQGINMIPWVVPHGKWPGSGPGPQGDSYAFEEGKMHGQYAAAAKAQTGNDRAVLIVDLEPSYYGGAIKQFWRDDLGAGTREVNLYLSGAAQGGASEVWLSSVWRTNPQALRDCSIDAWLANDLVTEVHPQVYWTDFGKSWRTSLAEFDNAQSALGQAISPARSRPTMPGNATVADIIEFVTECRRRGYRRPSIWRRGTVPSAVWRIIRDAGDWPVMPLPVPAPPGPSAANIERALIELADAEDTIAEARRLLGG